MTRRERLVAMLDAWNTHDLDAILEHYSDDFELISPIAKQRLSLPGDSLEGKDAVRAWWRRVLDRVPDIRFEFVCCVESIRSVSLVYRSSHNGGLVVSVYEFDASGRIRREEFFQ